MEGDPLTHRRPLRRPGLVERELPGELVLYDPQSDRAWLLNRTAAAVWDLADGATPLAAIAAELTAALGVPAEQARQDVLEAVRHLAGEGVLVRGAGTEPGGG
ncbi:MAG TPA: PqqD family protein [Thermoanaerobaculia bacterium]|nr:PqqD family protein [Thermoanaerobaculia bacterium]